MRFIFVFSMFVAFLTVSAINAVPDLSDTVAQGNRYDEIYSLDTE